MPSNSNIADFEIRRGTDISIAGWKQALFNMKMSGVPSVIIHVDGDSGIAISKVRNVTSEGFEFMASVVYPQYKAKCVTRHA